MPRVYLGLGSNLGHKEQNLQLAIKKIEEQIGKVVSLSAFYVTRPWGFDSENTFLNAVCCVEADLAPDDVLARSQEIEKEMGRAKKTFQSIYSDRIIDLDLLLYDELILNTEELTIPHPLMTERLFVMEPLVEIAPEMIHPVYKKTMVELLGKLKKKEAGS